MNGKNTALDVDGDEFVDAALYTDRHGDTWKYLGGIEEFLHVKRADEEVPVAGPNIVRHCEDAATIARDFGPMVPAPGMALHVALTTLAERWEQMADHGDATVGAFDGPAAATIDAEVAERGRVYRKAAADVREVLRTGRIPHDLMTDAELDEHGSKEAEK
ncbi:hypothetical protein [Streptomyces sp. NPDC004376]